MKGKELFEFKEINDEEAIIFYKMFILGYEHEDEIIAPISGEESLLKIEHIDHMLILQKSKSLLNRKVGLRKLLNRYIDSMCQDVIPGTNNNHLI